MNDTTTVMSLILGIGILVTLLMVVFLRKNKKEAKKGENDYRAFFIMGAAFLPTGIAMMLAYFLTNYRLKSVCPL
jgi:LPXTG-motif cell wall-anchored protein